MSVTRRVTDGLQLMLPALRSLTDALVDDAVQQTTEAGRNVSCRSGCSACCRQLVPVLPVEMGPIRKVIGSLPPAQREVVLERARHARGSAERAGLGPALDDAGGPTLASRHQLALDWFSLGLDCPFLEDRSCSIYAERPLACREYLVTNDPTSCEDPTGTTIAKIALKGSASEAYKRVATAIGIASPRTVIPFVDAILAAATPED